MENTARPKTTSVRRLRAAITVPAKINCGRTRACATRTGRARNATSRSIRALPPPTTATSAFSNAIQPQLVTTPVAVLVDIPLPPTKKRPAKISMNVFTATRAIMARAWTGACSAAVTRAAVTLGGSAPSAISTLLLRAIQTIREPLNRALQRSAMCRSPQIIRVCLHLYCGCEGDSSPEHATGMRTAQTMLCAHVYAGTSTTIDVPKSARARRLRCGR